MHLDRYPTMPDSPVLYALPACSIKAMDDNTIMLLRQDSGATAGLDARWQSFLALLQPFRTLPEHAAAIAANVPPLKGQAAQMELALQSLAQRKVLATADEVLTRYRSAPAVAPGPLTLCIRTADAPALLKRLLSSLQHCHAAFGRDWALEIYDNSTRSEHAEANAALARRFAADLEPRYFGSDARHAMFSALSEAAPADAEALRWLLGMAGDTQSEATRYGALTNLVLLRHAGRRVLLLDDTLVLRAWAPRVPQWRALFGNGQPRGAAFTSVEAAADRLSELALDPLASHAKTLGFSLYSAVSTLAGTPWPSVGLAGCPYGWAMSARPASARVRHTSSGQFGDTGTANDQGLLLQAPATMPDLIADDAAYRRFRELPRAAFSADPVPTLFNSLRPHQGACVGVDLAPFAAPLLPSGSGEPLVLAALLRYLYPQDYGLAMPYALENRPAETPSWQFAPALLDSPPSLPAALGEWIARAAAPVELSPAARLALLAEGIRGSAAASELEVALASQLTLQRSRSLADLFAATRQLLQQTPPERGCALWRDDVTAVGQHAARTLQEAPPIADAVVAELAAGLRRYADACAAWTRAFSWCRAHALDEPAS